MGLFVHRSNRVEHLAVDLAAQIRHSSPADPMVPVRVVVGSRGMARWLRHALAERLGICANVRFDFPSSVLGELLDVALGARTGTTRGFWAPEVLAFAILRVLPSLDGAAVAPLRTYLGASAEPPWDRRAFALARSMADVFDRYLLYRPDFVRAFEAGAPPTELAGDHDAELEAVLFRAVAAVAGEPHFVARAIELDRRLVPERPLPERLHLFGLSALPPAHVRVLASLARTVDVDLYLLCPSDRYWGDLRTARELHAELRSDRREAIADALASMAERQSPRLTALGRASRDFQLVLESLPGGYGDAELFADPRAMAAAAERAPSLLESIQSDVLTLVSRADLAEDPARAAERVIAPGDDSLRVHACAGPARQAEALRDAVLALLDDHPDLEPRDVLVMTPDVEAYAPLVTAAFDADAGGGHPRLRVQVSDRSLAAANPVLEALLVLLDLAASRVTAPLAMDLLALPVVHARFDIEPAELAEARAWVQGSGIRWGVDAEDREAAGQPREHATSFRFGLERIALGAFADDDALVFGALPLAGIDTAEGVRLAGRLLAFFDALFEHREALRAPGSVADFAARARRALAALTRVEGGATRASEEAHQAIASVEREAEIAGFDAPLTLDGFRRALEGRLAHGSGDRPIASAITLCALTPMRSVPFPVVCLLGMDDGAFPRPATAPGFDLAARDPRVGDRDPRDEDRHLVLEAILSARRHLHVFYTARDPRSGEARAPAAPVAELLAFVESTYSAAGGAHARDAIVIAHPLQPFSAKEFVARIPDPNAPERLRPAAFDATALEAARALAGPRVPARGAFDGSLLAPLDEPRLALDALVDFLRLPVRHLLRRRLGIVLAEDEGTLEAREATSLDGLDKWTFERDLLARAVRAAGERLGGPVDWDAIAAEARAGGRLPPGTPGELVLARLLDAARAIVRAAAARLDAPRRERIVELALDGRTLEARLHTVGERVVVLLGHDAPTKPRRLLEAWLALLALQAGTDAPCVVRVLGVAKGGEVVETELSVPATGEAPRERARALLRDLLALRDEGLARPLLLFE